MMITFPISTHILDVALGAPATGVEIRLEVRDVGGWVHCATGISDDDGRVRELINSAEIERAVYRLTFETAAYFEATGRESFYPMIQVIFEVADTDQHYHVPLLLSPFGYQTYRGS